MKFNKLFESIMREMAFVKALPTDQPGLKFKHNHDDDYKIETDDSKAIINYDLLEPKNSPYNCCFENRKLHEFLDYPELYSRLPDLKNINIECYVKFVNKNNCDSSFYFNSKKTIQLNVKSRNYIPTSLFHELQHAIQDVCSFKKGSNYLTCPKSTNNYDIEIVKQSDIFHKKYLKNNKTADIKDVNNLKQLIQKRYKDSNHLIEMSKDGHLNLQYLYYYSTVGEIEAREVSERYLYTKRQRLENMPKFAL